MDGAKRPHSIWSGDVEGVYTESQFMKYTGSDMRLSGSWSPKRFLVVSKKEDKGLGYSSIASSTSGINDKIREALTNVDFGYSPSILAQFFAPVMIDGRRVLQSMYEPFGVTYLGKGLCFYRNLSLKFKYVCSFNGTDTFGYGIRESYRSVIGPPSRVFVNGLPEYSPDIEFYSDSEYPSRDEILKFNIKQYMAVPVFQGDSKQCIGVLELVSTSSGSMGEIDKPAYIYGLMSTALQGVGLRTSAYASKFDMETNIEQASIGRYSVLREIQAVLEGTCTEHNLLFAQTWTDTEFKGCTPNVLSTTSDGYYYQRHHGFSVFRDTCESFCLPFGDGVVRKAFGSGGSCFCEDVGQLSIANYPFAHVARKVGLTSSFAISLKSYQRNDGYPDHPGKYVIELFLPSDAAANPQKFLEPIFLTIKNCLINFVTESRQDLYSGIKVEVIRASRIGDKMEFLTLFPDSGGGNLGGAFEQRFALSTQKQIVNPGSVSAIKVTSATAGDAWTQKPFNRWHGQQGFPSWDGNEGMMQPSNLSGTQESLHHPASISSTSCSLHSDTIQSMGGGDGGCNYLNKFSAITSWFLPDEEEYYGMGEDHDLYGMIGCMDLNNESPRPMNVDGSIQQTYFFSQPLALNEDQYSLDTLSMSTGAESSQHNSYSSAFATSEVECSPKKKVIRKSGSRTSQIDLERIEKLKGFTTIEDAARILKVSSSTLKRRLRDNRISWPRNKSTGNFTIFPASGSDCSKQSEMNDGNCKYVVSAENDIASSSKNQASTVVPFPGQCFMIIKAESWNGVKIKFQLPFSSQLRQMESEVAMRLNLEIGSFRILYLDEDDERITLTCDSDIRVMESMGKSTIRAYVVDGGSVPSH